MSGQQSKRIISIGINRKFVKQPVKGRCSRLKLIELGKVACCYHCRRLASEISFVCYTEPDASNVFAC